MNTIKRFFSITLLVVASVTVMDSCKKNSFTVTKRTEPEGKALVKIGMFNAYSTTTPVRISINGAYVSNEVSHPYAFPGGGISASGINTNSDYLQVEPGTAKFEFYAMNTGSPVPASKLYETSQTLEAGKRSTLFITDTSQNTATVLVNDDTQAPDSGFVRVKFVNLIPNLPAVDLYKGINAQSATLLMGNIAYKAVSDYMNVPTGADSFFVRTAGSPATTVPLSRRGFTFSNQRVYTILSRGYNGVAAATNRSININAIINQ